MIDEEEYESFKQKDLQQYKILDEVLMAHCSQRTNPTQEERDEHFAGDSFCEPFKPEGAEARITVHTALKSLERYVCR